MTENTVLKIAGLNKTFPDGTKALRDVSLEIRAGEFVVILGPSGAGKTTLMRCINGLVGADSGDIHVDGHDLTDGNLRRIRKKIGMVFQNFNLVGNLSVLNNVLTGLLDEHKTLPSLFYLFTREQKLRALECLDRVGLLSKAYARADQLSGGQQQRVGIARAIIRKPVVVLADEPVASLDPMISFNILSLLKDVNRSDGITVVCNLHQVDFALQFACRLIGLSDGKIVMDNPTESVDMSYIQNIYRGHDQGLYFGPDIGHFRPDDNVRFVV